MRKLIPQNKKGMLARDWIIAILIMTSLCGLYFVAISGIADEYDNTAIVDETFDTKYNKLTNATTDVSDIFEAASKKEGLAVATTFEVIFSSTFSIIQIVFGSFAVVSSITASFAEDFGIPDVVANLIFPMALAIITTIIVFVVISSVSRGKL